MNLKNDNDELFHCYFKINHKNKNELMPKKLMSKLQNSLLLSQGNNNINKIDLITKNFFWKKLYSKGNTIFAITNSLSKSFNGKNLDLRNKCEEYINILINNKREIYSSETLILSLDMIRKIGTIFFYGCKKLPLYNIKDEDLLRCNIATSRSLAKNVLNDYNQYCYENDIEPGQISKEKIWESNIKKYIIPPEYIFLENTFSHINTISIDFNWGQNFTEEDLDLFIAIIINKSYIFSNLTGINFELKNYSLLQNLYEIYEYDLKKSEIKLGNLFNFTNYDLELKNEKLRQWTFENDFIRITDKFIIDYDPLNIQLKSRLAIKNAESDLNESYLSTTSNSIDDIQINNSFINFNNNNNKRKENSYSDIINKFKSTIEAMIFFFGFINKITNISNLSLSFFDSHRKEFDVLLKKFYENNKELEYFHFLDFFFQFKKYEKFYINFNCLDYCSFSKINGLIDSYKQLKILKISFFSGDLSYITPALYKLYLTLEKGTLYTTSTIKQKHHKEIYKIILEELLAKFEENLTNFFVLFQNKRYLEEISIYLDTPGVILSEVHYVMVINKFILNFLLTFDGDNKNIKTLKLLSPYTRFDSRTNPSIEELFDEIDHQTNNKKLQKISLQIQFYQIKNISHLITTNLISLSIGELDEVSFIHLINFITSINFTLHSNLNLISIKLLTIISNFKKLKPTLKKLFNISINALKEIDLLTNFDLEEENDFIELVSLMNYTFTERFYLEIDSEQYKPEDRERFKKGLVFFKMSNNRRYTVLRRLFKSNKIIKECLSYLYPLEKLNLVHL